MDHFALRNTTMGDAFRKIADIYGNRESVVYGEERYRYSDLKEMADSISKGLINIGIEKGSKVAVWLPNCPEWICLLMGITQIGAVLIPMNPRYKSYDLEYIINEAGIEVLFTTDQFMQANYLGVLEEICPDVGKGEGRSDKVPTLREIVFVRNQKKVHFTLDDLIEGGKNISDSTLEDGISQCDPHEAIYILFTSGTTGVPKGAVRTADNVLQHAYDVGKWLLLQPGDRALGVIPFCGAWGCSTIIPSTLLHGCSLIMQDHFDVEESLKIIERERITLMHGVDVMFNAMADFEGLHNYDIFSLKKALVANFGAYPGLMDRVFEELKIEQATQALGMTEANACYLLLDVRQPVEDRKKIAGGKPLPGIEIKITDPLTWRELPQGETGEICIRGYTLLSGYFKGEEENKKVFENDGWFHTGDLGLIDEKGLVHFQGRLKEMYKSSGFNVTPREVEEFLLTHPDIEEVGVVGVPHPKFGETGMAFIKCKEGFNVEQKDMFQYCKGRIATFKIPQYIQITKKLPKVQGPHGDKISKVELQKMAMAILKNGGAQ